MREMPNGKWVAFEASGPSVPHVCGRKVLARQSSPDRGYVTTYVKHVLLWMASVGPTPMNQGSLNSHKAKVRLHAFENVTMLSRR